MVIKQYNQANYYKNILGVLSFKTASVAASILTIAFMSINQKMNININELLHCKLNNVANANAQLLSTADSNFH